MTPMLHIFTDPIKTSNHPQWLPLRYRTGRLICWDQAMYLKKRRVRLRTFLEHKRCYGNFDNLRLESSDSTYTYAIKGSTELQRDDTLARSVREGGCGLTSHRLWTIYIATWRPPWQYSNIPIKWKTDVRNFLPYRPFQAYFSHIQQTANRSNGNRFSHKFLKQVGFSVSRTRERWKGRRTIHRGSSSRKDDMYLTSATSESRFSTRQSLEILKTARSRRGALVSSYNVMGADSGNHECHNKSYPWAYEAQTNASCK
jgi:hypothetical protein